MADLDLLTDEERQIVRDLGAIWGRITAIVGDGPTRAADLHEIVAHIHALQHMIMSNAAARAFPTEFRLLGEMIAGTDG